MSIDELINKSDYKNVLKFFKEISAVPRGSGNNKGISGYLLRFAEIHGLAAVQDEALNIIIYKEATEGYEHVPAVIIQGHMDMVCVKKDGCGHDFTKDGIQLIVEDDYIRADNTTLGADDGIALAYGLALLADNDIPHPALEVLFTTDEETGMDGARAVDISKLSGRMIINIDSEDDTTALISCAGGLTVEGRLPLERNEYNGGAFKLKISGLKGGHSGAEIDKNRTNAVLLMARLLTDLKKSIDYRLVSIGGGEKDNAIPCLCEAEIVLDDIISEEAVKSLQPDYLLSGILKTENESDEDKQAVMPGLTDEVRRLALVYKHELSLTEPGLMIEINKDAVKSDRPVLSRLSQEKLLFILNLSPNGVQVMSTYISGLVESSLNLGIMNINGDEAVFRYSVRSSLLSYKHYVRDKIINLFMAAGGSTKTMSEYPAWEYKKDSRLRDIYKDVYYNEYGGNPKFEAIHAGLECGIISEKMPDADIISIGPKMHGIHTVEEKMSISSAVRLYKFLEKLLEHIV